MTQGLIDTEALMLAMLRARYTKASQGLNNRYAIAEHVRSHAGFNARRTADFVAMDLWTSSGLMMHGHEVKVSRPDWLSELKQPEKAGEFIPYFDYWWLVVADKSIVRDDLPDGWGLMVAQGQRLVVKHRARRNHNVRPMPRTRWAALLRAVAKTAAKYPGVVSAIRQEAS